MHRLIAALATVPLVAMLPQKADAVSQALRDACRQDYLAYCSMHEVESEELRDCMADAFDKLSPPCVSAILDSEAANDQRANPDQVAIHSPKKREARHARHEQRGHHSRLASGKAKAVRFARRIRALVVGKVRHVLR